MAHLYLCQQSVNSGDQLLNLPGHLGLALLEPVHHLIELVHVLLQVFDLYHAISAIDDLKKVRFEINAKCNCITKADPVSYPQ